MRDAGTLTSGFLTPTDGPAGRNMAFAVIIQETTHTATLVHSGVRNIEAAAQEQATLRSGDATPNRVRRRERFRQRPADTDRGGGIPARVISHDVAERAMIQPHGLSANGFKRMRVIDFRARPNVPEYAAYLRPRLDAIAAETGGFGRYQAPDQSVDEFVMSLDAAGITAAVFVARNRTAGGDDWPLTNDLVAEAAAAHPDRLIAFGGLDLSDVPSAADEAHRCIEELGFRGLSIDPFQVGLTADDDAIDPIYETCERAGVALAITLGGMPGIRQSLRTGDPIALDEVAQSYPDLVIVGSHAGWPFTMVMAAVAWRRPNVYFENSFYHFAPGAKVLVDAANTMIGHKMLYASAFPFAPLPETLEGFRGLDFAPDVLEDVLYGNARRLLERVGALSAEKD